MRVDAGNGVGAVSLVDTSDRKIHSQWWPMGADECLRQMLRQGYVPDVSSGALVVISNRHRLRHRQHGHAHSVFVCPSAPRCRRISTLSRLFLRFSFSFSSLSSAFAPSNYPYYPHRWAEIKSLLSCSALPALIQSLLWEPTIFTRTDYPTIPLTRPFHGTIHCEQGQHSTPTPSPSLLSYPYLSVTVFSGHDMITLSSRRFLACPCVW